MASPSRLAARALRRALLSAPMALALLPAGPLHGAQLGADGVLEFKFCIEENPYPPMILRDRDGAIPILLKMAAREAGVRVVFHRAPFVRCLAETRAGANDGYPAVAATIEGRAAFVFPGAPGEPDPARAIARGRLLVYRRVGTAVDWDGKQFHGLARAVLHDRGALLAGQRLAALGVRVDNSASNTEANLDKLLAGRGDASVAIELAASPLLAQARYQGKIEALPLPFYTDDYYLGIAPAVYARHKPQVEALWQAISRLRHTPEYAAAIRDLPTR
ncbi:hypothetical protein ABT364_14600 [Massilia sp. SR12]